ncbi:MAG: hypothetical protein RL095_3048 [Verrucomicrobiota bacterium]|jgi:apolipoprotein D and lipocalin family protein
MKHLSILMILLSAFCSLSSCASREVGLGALQPVKGFRSSEYLGTWYEIARFDHFFERGLSQVTATYSQREDGGIRVLNRGFDGAKGEWREAEGKAYLLAPDRGQLRVSFFGPFYGPYLVLELDPQYRWALVSSGDGYLWILSRTPKLEQTVIDRLLARSRELGFDTSKFIWVEQKEAPITSDHKT